MSDKLQELTERLYQDGVERARNEAAAIIADAESRRDALLAKAEEDARSIVERGRRDAESLAAKTAGELSMAARQAESALKQRLVTLLADTVLGESVAEALEDDDLLTDLMTKLMAAWTADGQVPDIAVMMGEGDRKRFDAVLRSRLRAHLDKAGEIAFSPKIKGGFRVEARDGSYAVSFTDRDFEEFFRSFLRERSRVALYGES